MKLSPMVLISRPLHWAISFRLCAKCARRTSFMRSSFSSSPNAVEPTTSVKTMASVTRSSPAHAVKLGVLVSPRADWTNISKSRWRSADCSIASTFEAKRNLSFGSASDTLPPHGQSNTFLPRSRSSFT